MKIKTQLKAGKAPNGMPHNHNQTVARALNVKTNVKTGSVGNGYGAGSSLQRNPTMARGLKVKTGIKAGPPDTPTVRD